MAHELELNNFALVIIGLVKPVAKMGSFRPMNYLSLASFLIWQSIKHSNLADIAYGHKRANFGLGQFKLEKTWSAYLFLP